MSSVKGVVIAVDGPAASGKGTLSKNLANHFGFARLDTGLIYRAVGMKVWNGGGDFEDKNRAILAAEEVSYYDLDLESLRTETAGVAASKVAIIPEVRKVLLTFQRNFLANPPIGKSGVVLDGRDIGTIVCPGADHKIFLVASAEVRAARRFKELQEHGSKAIHSRILRDMKDRDKMDLSRSVAPLEPAKDAYVLDTSSLDADETFVAALNCISTRDRRKR